MDSELGVNHLFLNSPSIYKSTCRGAYHGICMIYLCTSFVPEDHFEFHQWLGDEPETESEGNHEDAHHAEPVERPTQRHYVCSLERLSSDKQTIR